MLELMLKLKRDGYRNKGQRARMIQALRRQRTIARIRGNRGWMLPGILMVQPDL